MTQNMNDQPVGSGLVAVEEITGCLGLEHLEPFWTHVARCPGCNAWLDEFVASLGIEQKRAWDDLVEDVEIEDTLFDWAEDDRG